MQIKIYQIDETKDLKAVMFTEYETHVKRMGKIVKDIYKEIFQGEVNVPEKDINRILDYVFFLFNVHVDMFPDYKGHSLSVSDVVISDGVAYYVNTFGFVKLETF